MTTCMHLQDGSCLVASNLAEADIKPLPSQCDYCTQHATPSQSINLVTVSLAYKASPSKRAKLLRTYRHILSPDVVAMQQEHWRLLHTSKMDAKSFSIWLDGIPKQCDCRKSIESILESNPPRFDDWWRWGWEFHNAINAKLNKPEIIWDDASRLWNWN